MPPTTPLDSHPDHRPPDAAGSHEARVRELFDGMAHAYDDLHDLWYGYLFDRLHVFLERRYRSHADGLRVLDVGCGTGQQALPLASWGARVTAVDLAAEPLTVAAQKARKATVPLELAQASALELPVRDRAFDLVVSCGSVISFVEDYEAAIGEFRRVLKRGGEVALEFEHRWSFDLLWPLVDSAIGGRLGYGQSLSRSLRNLVALPSRPVRIDYPFVRPDGVRVVFHLWLFPTAAVEDLLERHGFEVLERHTIHSLTNLLPSTLLNDPAPSPWVSRTFQLLGRIEDRYRESWPLRAAGNSLFVLARKR